jgi:hypothetical protein
MALSTVPIKVTTNVPKKYRREEMVRRYKQHMNAAHRKSVDSAKRTLKEAIRLTGAVASRALLNSVTSRLISSRATSNMMFETEVGFKPPGSSYAFWANYGRDAGGMPPANRILSWMRKKGIAEEHLFAIMRTIADEGTEGHEFLELAIPIIARNTKQNYDEAAASFADDLRR